MGLFRRKKEVPIPEDVQRYVVEHTSRIMEACINKDYAILRPYIARRRGNDEQIIDDFVASDQEEFDRYPARHILPSQSVWPELLDIRHFGEAPSYWQFYVYFWTDMDEPSDLSIRGEVVRQEDGSLVMELIGIRVW